MLIPQIHPRLICWFYLYPFYICLGNSGFIGILILRHQPDSICLLLIIVTGPLTYLLEVFYCPFTNWQRNCRKDVKLRMSIWSIRPLESKAGAARGRVSTAQAAQLTDLSFLIYRFQYFTCFCLRYCIYFIITKEILLCCNIKQCLGSIIYVRPKRGQHRDPYREDRDDSTL